MENINKDEKKVNLIKCPLPNIIYTTINGLTTFQKKSFNTSNNSNTYYSRKINNKSPGLPSLKTNNKFSSSPNKTNYISIKMNNNLNKNNNNEKNNKSIQINKIINNNKDIKKLNLKEVLKSYGLSKYYDKIVELGINDDNINNLGLMNKKALNEFISNLKMFPSHIIKMEQLYQHLKQINSFNKQLHNNINSKNNNTNNNENTNCVNYVTLSFNRNNNNNIANKIMHSQSHNKYRFINPILKSKNQKINNINLENAKIKFRNKTNYSHHKILIKNRSKKNMNNKSNFELPTPLNVGRNILIKYFFKDLANYANNISEIANNVSNIQNKKNNNIVNELDQDKKLNNNSINNKENQLLKKDNNQEKNSYDLPSINNKINTHNSLRNSNNRNNNNISQSSPKIEKLNKVKTEELDNKNKKNKNINNIDKLDKSKTINNYQMSYSINSFMKEEYIKNKMNNNINLQKTQYESSKKNN